MALKWENGKVVHISPPKKLSKKVLKEIEEMKPVEIPKEFDELEFIQMKDTNGNDYWIIQTNKKI
jgi:hypothetical protein